MVAKALRIVFSEHALQQLREREMSRAAIVETLRRPVEIVEGHSGRRVAQRVIRVGGVQRLLRVVFVEDRGTTIVVTVYRTAKLAKYLKG